MDAKDFIALVGRDEVISAVKSSFSKHFNENLDLYEEFIDNVLQKVAKNNDLIEGIALSIGKKLADDIDSGEIDIAGANAIDSIFVKANELAAEKLRKSFGL